jgi:Family of unknown function (DUF6786)
MKNDNEAKMKKICGISLILLLVSGLAGCTKRRPEPGSENVPDSLVTYQSDITFLQKYAPGSVELTNHSGQSRILIGGKYQGRVMTSTAGGKSGDSFGWINYALIRSGIVQKQFNPVGGEERLWIGPEGGQFSFYFNPGDSFDISNWQVPCLIDTVTYEMTKSDSTSAVFTKESTLRNYSETEFTIQIKREVRLLDDPEIKQKTGFDLRGTRYVAYETTNQIKNNGTRQWKKEDGLPSIWLLSMMRPSPETVVFIPFHPVAEVDSLITDNYFGKVPEDRLIRKDSVLILKCDGKHRSKVGLSPRIAKPYAASYDFKKNILSIIVFPVDSNGLYANSKWEIQSDPYRGDVVNAYNDGPLADGAQLGPFYELESSSSVKELNPGEIMEHKQVMVHIHGSLNEMQELTYKLLGVHLSEIRLP